MKFSVFIVLIIVRISSSESTGDTKIIFPDDVQAENIEPRFGYGGGHSYSYHKQNPGLSSGSFSGFGSQIPLHSLSETSDKLIDGGKYSEQTFQTADGRQGYKKTYSVTTNVKTGQLNPFPGFETLSQGQPQQMGTNQGSYSYVKTGQSRVAYEPSKTILTGQIPEFQPEQTGGSFSFGNSYGYRPGIEQQPAFNPGVYYSQQNLGPTYGTFGSGHIEGGDIKEQTANFIQGETYKSCRTIEAVNSQVTCSQNSCTIKCIKGYKFSYGEREIRLVCSGGNWLGGQVPTCEPECFPPCENKGICISNGICQCPEDYHGPFCEKKKIFCLARPVGVNMKLTCSNTMCTAVCREGYKFPDGSKVTNMACEEGVWRHSPTGQNHLPDCKPTCNPPCQNGGSCYSVNLCSCTKEYHGTQCQYDYSVCNITQVGFNGLASCSYQKESVVCTISCPLNIKFEFPSVTNYTCQYSMNKFVPNMPRCLYPRGTTVIRGNQQAKSIHQSTMTITSSSVITELDDVYSLYVTSNVIVKEPGPGVCITWGGINMKTFDGLIFRAPLYCAHTLVKDSENEITITKKTCPYEAKNCKNSLFIYLQNILYTCTASDGNVILTTPKKRLPVPAQILGMKVVQVAKFLRIEFDKLGLVVLWDLKEHVSIEANAQLFGRLSGLCGTFDMDRENDFSSRIGTPLKSVQAFVDEWSVPEQNEDCKPQKMQLETLVCDNVAEAKATEICTRLIKNKKLKECVASCSEDKLLQFCIDNYCKCQNKKNPKSCACDALSIWAKECTFKGIKLENGWRDLEVCPVECTNGRIYSPCGPATSPTCGSITNLIKESCHEGCYCPEGTVQHRGECILPELCPCTKGKKVFMPGTVIKEDCNSCTCTSGIWSCSNETCGARCAAIGDPHYTTFDGKRYDFMGKCSYYLLKTGELSVVGENVPCPGSISAAMNLPPSLSPELPSCTKSVTIQIPVNGKDFSIKLAQGPIVYVNNNEILKYPKIIGDDAVVIRQASSNFVSVDLANGVRVWWDGITRVYIDAPASLRHTTQGLCGTFNSNTQDDFLTPENDIETAVEPFAEKWRTDETCDYASDAPAVPNTCETNPANKERGEEKCMKLLSEAFEECNWSVEPEPFYENCMFDVCACQGDVDACVCPILAAYAAECSRQGIETNWRENVTECDLKCPQGQVYEECGDGCVRSCDDISRNDTCSSPCVEGCRCPKGQYLNDKNECIPEKMCPCKHEGLSFIPEHKEVRAKEGSQQLCTCTNGAWNCLPATPEDLVQYPPASELKAKCEKRQFSEFTKCAPKEPKNCKNMHEYVQTLEDCSPDCVCKDGYVLDVSKDACVLPIHCSCHHAGKSYSDGEVIKEDCNKCKCQGGKWACTKNVCASTCSVWGDSHFSTFDNKDFDFQGACDYVLSKGTGSDGDGFIITIQNVLCGSLGVTCSKSVKIALTGSSKDSLTLSSDPVDMKSMQKYKKFDDNSTNSFVVYNAGVFVVVEVLDLGLQLKWDRGTRVYIKLNNQWKSKVSGLCGNYNDDAQDDMATPSLSLETSPTIFGHSWKLEDYCSAPVEPIDACNEHPERKTWAHHKCGIIKSDIFKDCHGEVPYEKYMKRCIFDTCACDQGGDCECLCTALAAYAYDCSTKGVKIKWRTQSLCPMQCDPHCSEYSSCTQACPVETCDNFREQGAVERICSTETCSEGCHIKPCEDGKIYLNDTFIECVPKATCKPVCMEKEGITYYESDITQSDGCQICRCVKGQEVCSGEPCSTPLFVAPTTPTALSTQPPVGIGGICDPSVPHVEYPGDCYKFLHCLPKANGEWAYAEKTCGPSMMYNPTNMICDHIYSVKLIKPECGEPTLSTPKPTTHQPMMVPDCSVLSPLVESLESCYEYKECVKAGVNWIYVDKYCVDSKMFNPSTLKCDDPNVVLLIKPICRTEIPSITTASYGTTTVAPTRSCIKENIIPIVTGFPGLPDAVFSATSVLGPGSLPKYARINGKPTSISNGSWSPITNDPSQYLQLNLPQVIPLYGIEMQGSPIFDQYVTQYKITHSDDGTNFHMLSDEAGSPQIFQGPQTSRDSANYFFKAPIEAQVVRIYPVKWHGAISMRVELYGCSDTEILKPETQTTVLQIKPTPKPTPPPTKCSDYMTEEGQFTPEQVKASSELVSPSVKGKKPRLNEILKLTSPIAWRPKANKKLQYVSFDFLEPRNLTGLITKGGPDGWVTSYVVRYSKNGKIWNNIAPDQIPQIFVGNYDSDTPNINYFMYPIRAQNLKIVPVTWHDNINMRIEPLGCFEPIDTKTTPIPVVPERICNICPEVDVNLIPFGDKCKCEEPLYWEGSKCVERNLCPCVSNNVRYKNGDGFENANCEKCTCLEGSSQCVEKKCDPCPKGLRRDLSKPCSCLCKECPPTERLCPSSGDCIPEALWCNGYQDCEDDEKDCIIEPPPIDEFTFINNTCPTPSCPNGMEVKLTKNPRKMSMMFETGSTETSRSPTEHPPSSTNCVEYTCVYTLIGKPTFCPPPVCANNYEVAVDKTVVVGPNDCPSYNCVPPRQPDRTCKNVGKSFATFDGTEFKYDACNHILARDVKGLSWIVTLNVNCSYDYKTSRCQKEVIIRDKLEKYVLVLMPSLKVKFNNYDYDVHQLEKASYDQFGFLISQPGKTISYVSKTHGFWVMYGSDGDVEIGMSLEYVNTVDGLCGFFNDDPSDDKRLPNGKQARNTAEFGDAWVSKEVPNTICKAQVCTDEGNSAWDICNTIKHEVFDACSKVVNYQQFVLKCVETTCECLKAGKTADGVSCKCAALERYVKECLSINPDVHLDTWRGSHNCEISCTPPLLYKDCYKRRCEPSCNTINKNSCPLVQKECFSGCFCPEGTVRKGDTCVSVNDCRNCICTEFGKSKFVTYDRQNFTFDGNCTYLLSRDILVPGAYNFQVYVTMGNCDMDKNAKHSCAKSLHIIHDPHIIHMQKKPNGETQILVDGLEPSALPTKNSWLELQKNGKNEIIAKLLNSHVDVYSSFEDMTFSIHVPSIKYGSKMEGLCGDCDQNPDNDLKVNAKSKKEITGNTIKDIAESWVSDEPKLGADIGECMSGDAPRDECIVPDPAVDPCMKLLDKDLFGKCHLFVDPVIYLSACHQDLCSPGSSQQGVCESLTAYAHECLRNGICVDWRRTGLCPYECPANLQYNHCGCLRTCESKRNDYMLDLIVVRSTTAEKMTRSAACNGELYEGCFCPEGKVSFNDRCIPEKECTVCDDQVHYQGDTWMKDKCTECSCNKKGKIECTKKDCSVQGTICGEGFDVKVIKDDEECCPKYICVPIVVAPTVVPVRNITCLEQKPLKCSQYRTNKLKKLPNGCFEFECVCIPKEECPPIKNKAELNLKAGEEVQLEANDCCSTQNIVCKKSLCPPKPAMCDVFYELEEIVKDKECCPEYKCVPPKNTCIVNIGDIETLKKLGDKWQDPKDPCVQKICSFAPNGELKELSERTVCDLYCAKGFKYTAEPGKCCGKCVQVMCIHGDQIHKPGEVWFSEDNCTKHTCVERENQLSISSYQETCPNVEDCPEKFRFEDGCCIKCNLPPMPQTNCLSESLAEKETLGLIQVTSPTYGVCVNKQPIIGFTECRGSCPSGTKFNPGSYSQEKVCDCCSILWYEKIEVPLSCSNGATIKKIIQIPSLCGCQPCAETVKPNTKTAMNW